MYLWTLSVCSDSHAVFTHHGHMLTTRVHVPVKTAMEKEQTRERERYTRTIASRRIRR